METPEKQVESFKKLVESRKIAFLKIYVPKNPIYETLVGAYEYTNESPSGKLQLPGAWNYKIIKHLIKNIPITVDKN